MSHVTEQLHRELAKFNHTRVAPAYDSPDWLTSLQIVYRMRRIEQDYVERDSLAIRSLAREAPQDPQQFVAWFEALEQTGPGQLDARDALFPWLAEQASLEELRWFVRQDLAAEAGFDDLLGMTREKQNPSSLEKLGKALQHAQSGEDIVWEALAVSNLMVALATNGRYAHQSIGALGVIQLTTPARTAQVNRGLKRLGIQPEARRSALQATQSNAWDREALAPLIAENPEVASRIAEGALLRMTAAQRCFERYRRELSRPAALWELPMHEPAVRVA